jgi:ArsR family transcriptional regulator
MSPTRTTVWRRVATTTSDYPSDFSLCLCASVFQKTPRNSPCPPQNPGLQSNIQSTKQLYERRTGNTQRAMKRATAKKAAPTLCDGHAHPSTHEPLIDIDLCSRAASIFRALGDPSRLQLLALLARREMCVTELTERLGDNLPAISQRLKLLRIEKIVRSRRQGKHIYYSLSDEHIKNLISNGLAHGEESC